MSSLCNRSLSPKTLTLWILLLTTTVSTLATDTAPPNSNITTLYPVPNITITRHETLARLQDTTITPNDTKSNKSDTDNKTDIKTIPTPQSWKIESAFAESNLTEVESNKTETSNYTEERKGKNDSLKDFKPSQHLGSFFDEDSAEVIKTPMFGPVSEKQPASGFVSSPKDQYHNHGTFNQIPKEIYYTHKEFPYQIEDTIYTRTKGRWPEGLDSKPTVEAPVKVPAGGLYQSPEAFKEKPQSGEDFVLEYYEDGREEHAVKKRVNPWQNLLRLVTAFIPVGLIISALTPSVITIHNVEDNKPPSSLGYRRSDAAMSNIAAISEQCRRRLLCELHSERHYIPPSVTPRRTKHCYKIHCEDTEALWRMLRWLFSYNKSTDDQRARNIS